MQQLRAQTTSLFCTLAREAKTILDIGAADGIYAIFAAATNPAARVVAFEPVQVEACRANIARNRPLTDRVELQPIALADLDGELPIYVAGNGGTSSLNAGFRRVHQARTVTVRRGDSVVRELGLAKVDLIKMDTESTEPAVLRGLAACLGRDRPDIICEVLVGRTERELEELLRPYGYLFYGISPEGLRHAPAIVGDASYRCPNYLFTRRSPGALAALGLRVE